MRKKLFAILYYRLPLLVIIFLNDIIVTRWLGAELKGYFYICILTPMLISTMVMSGQGVAVNYFKHNSDISLNILLTASYIIVMFMSLVFVGVLLEPSVYSFIYVALPNKIQILGYVSLGFILFESIMFVTIQGIISKGDPVGSIKVRIVRRSSFLFLLVICMLCIDESQSLSYVLYSALLSLILSSVYSMYVVRYSPIVDVKVVRIMFLKGLRGLGTRISEQWQARVSPIIIGYITAVEYVGYYSVSLVFSELIYFVSSSIALILLSEKQSDDDKFFMLVRIMMILNLILAVFIFLGGTILIPFLYGNEFSASVEILAYLIPNSVFVAMMQIVYPYVIQNCSVVKVSIVYLFGLFLTIVFSMIFIPIMNAVGAAISSSLATGITIILLLAIAGRKKINVFIPRWGDVAYVMGRVKSVV